MSNDQELSYEEIYKRDVLPLIIDSPVVVLLIGKDFNISDVRISYDLGVAIFSGKPLIIATEKGVTIDSRLVTIAAAMIPDFDIKSVKHMKILTRTVAEVRKAWEV